MSNLHHVKSNINRFIILLLSSYILIIFVIYFLKTCSKTIYFHQFYPSVNLLKRVFLIANILNLILPLTYTKIIKTN